MINTVWFGLIFFSIFTAVATGKVNTISESIFQSTNNAVNFALGLAGAIAFWSGILKVAETAGLTQKISKLFQPLLTKLFPRFADNEHLIGLISMTITANLLGLGNVATPLGLKTMEALVTFNSKTEQTSDEICTFLGLVLGGICLFPSTLIAVRAEAGSTNPGLIIAPVFLVSLCGTLTLLTLNYLIIKLPTLIKKE